MKYYSATIEVHDIGEHEHIHNVITLAENETKARKAFMNYCRDYYDDEESEYDAELQGFTFEYSGIRVEFHCIEETTKEDFLERTFNESLI